MRHGRIRQGLMGAAGPLARACAIGAAVQYWPDRDQDTGYESGWASAAGKGLAIAGALAVAAYIAHRSRRG